MNSTSRAVNASSTGGLSTATRIYIGVVIAAGALVLAGFAPREVPRPLLALTFLAAMVIVSLFKLRLPLGRGQSTMSMAYVVDFAVLITSGADLAMAIAAVGVLVQCTVNVCRPQPRYRAAFSVAAVVLSVRTAGWAWAGLGGGVAATPFLPLVVAAFVYFAINTGLVAGAIALSSGSSPVHCWQQSFMRTAPSYLAAAAVVAGIEFAATSDAYLLLAYAALPMALCHVAYAHWFRRLSERITAERTPALA